MEAPETKLLNHLRGIHVALMIVGVTIVIALVELRTPRLLDDIHVAHNIVEHFAPDAARHRDLGPGVLEDEVRRALFGVTGEDLTTIDAGKQAAVHGNLTVGPNGAHVIDGLNIEVVAPVGFVVHDSQRGDRNMGPAYSDFFLGGAPHYSLARDPCRPGDPGCEVSNPIRRTGLWEQFQELRPNVAQFAALWDTLTAMRHGYLLQSIDEYRAYEVSDEPAPKDKHGPGRALPIRELSSPLRDAGPFSDACRSLIPLPAVFSPVPSSKATSYDYSLSVGGIFSDAVWFGEGLRTFDRSLLAIIHPGKEVEWEDNVANLRPHDIVVTARATYAHRTLDLEGTFLADARADGRVKGTFGETFAALDELWKDLRYDRDASLTIVEAIAERDTRGEHSLEVGGLKIEHSAVGLWGTVIMLVLQIYFITNLREFLRRCKPGAASYESPWFPVFPDRFCGLLLYLSIVLLPGTAAVIALRAGLNLPEGRLPVSVTAIISIFACLTTIRWLVRLRRHVYAIDDLPPL